MKTTVLGMIVAAAATAGVVMSLGQRNQALADPTAGAQKAPR